jgi:F0F1-type ATP synthase epsilon subunit
LRPGVVAVWQNGKATDKVFVRGGFAEVTPQGLTILAEQAIHMEDFDGAAVDAQIRHAEENFRRRQDRCGAWARARDARPSARVEERIGEIGASFCQPGFA